MDILERDYQAKLIRKIYKEMPDAIVLKTDPNYRQGFPDLLVLRGRNWAALEVKKNGKAAHRPNQDYYVATLDRMSYARFIFPENEREIMNGLREILGARRKPRVSEPKQLSLD